MKIFQNLFLIILFYSIEIFIKKIFSIKIDYNFTLNLQKKLNTENYVEGLIFIKTKDDLKNNTNIFYYLKYEENFYLNDKFCEIFGFLSFHSYVTFKFHNINLNNSFVFEIEIQQNSLKLR